MPGDAKIRASDADRDRVAAALREHFAAGRLTTEEFTGRLGQAFAAKTQGDLDNLLADLPGLDLEWLRMVPTAGPADERPVEFGAAWHAAWRPWLVISLFFFAIWLVSGATGGLWFVYPSLIAGAVLLLRRLRNPPQQRGHDQIRTDEDWRQLGR